MDRADEVGRLRGELVEIYEKERADGHVNENFEPWLRRRAEGHCRWALDREVPHCLEALRMFTAPEQGRW